VNPSLVVGKVARLASHVARRGSQEINFDTRDLKPYAEPVATSSLTEGQEYFSVQYADEDMLIPVIETWVYLGRDLEKAGKQLYTSRISNLIDTECDKLRWIRSSRLSSCRTR